MNAISSVPNAGMPIQALQANELMQQNGLQTGGPQTFFQLPTSIEQPKLIDTPSTSQGVDVTGPTSWGQMVKQMVLDVNQSQATAGEKVRDVLAGGKTSIDEAMVSLQESSVRFQFLAELRNKAVDAYQEVMRMQV